MLIRKKLFFCLLTVVFLLSFSGCKSADNDDGKINIVCTMFPEYDWTVNLTADCPRVNITYLINNGTDPHSYQPTAKDIALIASADIFIYGGGESEAWIEDALKIRDCNPDMKIINMMELLEGHIYVEEEKEGMQEGLHKHEEEEPEYDEHVRLSLRNAAIICEAISSSLIEAVPEDKALFEKACDEYLEKLEALDKEYVEMMDNSATKLILVADRFPFRYLVEDYGIDYYAAFSGCSADAEASFETLVFLSECIAKNKLSSVIILEGSDDKLAKAAIKNSKCVNLEILVLDSMQAVRAGEADKADYINIMKQNLETLKKALNRV